MFENSLKEAYGWEYWIAACCSGEEMRSHWSTEMTNCANTEWSQRRPRAKLPYLVHWFCKWRTSSALAREPETSQGREAVAQGRSQWYCLLFRQSMMFLFCPGSLCNLYYVLPTLECSESGEIQLRCCPVSFALTLRWKLSNQSTRTVTEKERWKGSSVQAFIWNMCERSCCRHESRSRWKPHWKTVQLS